MEHVAWNMSHEHVEWNIGQFTAFESEQQNDKLHESEQALSSDWNMTESST